MTEGTQAAPESSTNSYPKPDVPVLIILISATDDMSSRQQAIEAGALDLFKKLNEPAIPVKRFRQC
jgi:CheY-like chemotaxis protein